MPEQTIDEQIHRAEVLIEALPYIKRFSGHILVIKVGGAASAAADLGSVLEDVVLLRFVGMRPVIVHGGGPEITSYMRRLNLPVESFIQRTSATVAVPPGGQIAEVVLDPDHVLPDADRSNNSFAMPAS